MASKCPSEKQSHIARTLSQKLEMIGLTEEGMLKAEMGWKLSLLHLLGQVVNTKEKSLMEIESANSKWTYKW